METASHILCCFCHAQPLVGILLIWENQYCMSNLWNAMSCFYFGGSWGAQRLLHKSASSKNAEKTGSHLPADPVGFSLNKLMPLMFTETRCTMHIAHLDLAWEWIIRLPQKAELILDICGKCCLCCSSLDLLFKCCSCDYILQVCWAFLQEGTECFNALLLAAVQISPSVNRTMENVCICRYWFLCNNNYWRPSGTN